MNADRLLTHYGRIADAPDAIARLRRFILALAVRGKLVEQDPNEEPAAELLKRIAAEKARLVKAGEIRNPKQVAVIDASECFFGPPRGWEWRRLLEISRKIHYGFTASANNTIDAVRLLRITDIHDNSVDWFSVPGCEIGEKALPQFKLEKGDILVARTGGTIGKSLLVQDVPVTVVFASYLIRVQGSHEIYDRYLKLFLESPIYWIQLQDGSRGAGQPNVNGQTLGKMLVPLPPLAEQHRIVAKVDELTGLCDRLEAARTEREATRDRMAAASLVRLNDPDPDPVVFRNHAAFAIENLTPLTIRRDQIKVLRQTILNLAVRGKLVPQDPNDEPASELVKQIAAEKARLVRSGKIKKPKALPEMLNDEPPFLLPPKWRWSQIAEIGIINPRNNASEDLTASFVPMPMIPAEYGLENQHQPRPWAEIKKGYTHFAEGDVGVAKITPCFENGKSTVFRELTGGLGSGTTELHIVRPLFVNPDYIIVFLKCPHFIETGIPRMTGTAGQKRVPIEYFSNSPFPLPPLAEQHRIVAKVDELLALCDRLETSFTTGDDTRRRLLDALLHEVLVMGADRKSVA